MKVASDKFDVICRDNQGEEHNLLGYGYNESGNTINVETQVYNTALQRGWIGDLYYLIRDNIDIETYDENDLKIIDTYKDVLLTSVTPMATHGNATCWKYTFLKK